MKQKGNARRKRDSRTTHQIESHKLNDINSPITVWNVFFEREREREGIEEEEATIPEPPEHDLCALTYAAI